MALTITLLTDQNNMAMYTAPGRIYVDSTRTKVVPESSEEAAYLLVPAGGSILMEEAIKFGLVEVKVEVPEVKVESEPEIDDDEEPEVKSVESGLNKAISKFRNK